VQVFGESLGLDAAHQALRVEREGFDGLVAVDHFYSGRGSSPPRWRVEPVVALGVAAAVTSRITLAAMVMNVNFHHPAVIAHAMASLQEVSGGRAELGLGAGWYAPEHLSFGLPWGDAATRTERLLESAVVCRAMLEHRGVVTHRGAHFNVDNEVPWEWGGAGRTVPVAIGAARESLLYRAAEVVNRVDLLHVSIDGAPVVDEAHGRSADRVERLVQEVRSRAAAAGNSVKVSATLTSIVVSAADAASVRERLAPSLHSSPNLLERDLLYVIGSQDDLLRRIGALAALGVDRIHVIPGQADSGQTLDAVREMLADIQGL
jgi:alkanesulfonate monooxygenase SsuD/methylene tetrahydromethanopterin reductase-like flavin-dependent oxidoreductase (luciferase family)